MVVFVQRERGLELKQVVAIPFECELSVGVQPEQNLRLISGSLVFGQEMSRSRTGLRGFPTPV